MSNMFIRLRIVTVTVPGSMARYHVPGTRTRTCIVRSFRMTDLSEHALVYIKTSF
jgi:hypothetical protein